MAVPRGRQNPVTERPNVVVVLVDALRADAIDPASTPELAKFTSDSVRFARAYAPSTWPPAAVASILTGTTPVEHGFLRLNRDLPDHASTLAEELGESGWGTAAVMSDFRISKSRGFSQGFELFDSASVQGPEIPTSDDVTERALAALDTLRASGRSAFVLAHYHDPYPGFAVHSKPAGEDESSAAPGASGPAAADGEAAPATESLGGATLEYLQIAAEDCTEAEVAEVKDLYRGEVAAVDAAIGRLLDGLADRGLERNTVVVVAGTAGIELFDRGWIGVAHDLTEELAHVPMLVRLPGLARAGRVIGTPVSLTGLAPTIEDLLGVTPVEERARERSFSRLVRGLGAVEREPVVVEADWVPPLGHGRGEPIHRVALIEERWKIVHDRDSQETYLFDLDRDPGELVDLSEDEPETLSLLAERLDAASALQR